MILSRTPDPAAEARLGAALAGEERRLLGALALWAAASLAGGAASWRAGRRRTATDASSGVGRLLVGVGRQAVGWGAVDAAVAGWGATHGRPAAATTSDARHRARRMAAITALNAVADIGYLAGGIRLLRNPARRADGVGMVVQAGFLLWLDGRHAAKFTGYARKPRAHEA